MTRLLRSGALPVLVVLLVVSACTSSPASSPGVSGPVDLVIETDRASDLVFVPADPSVAAASTVRILFRNVSGQPHNLTFEGIDARSDTIVSPGGSDDVTLVDTKPGTYSFVCTIHPSMKGVLTVR